MVVLKKSSSYPNDLLHMKVFQKPLQIMRLNQQQKLMAKNILRLGEKIELVAAETEGFGNAVLCAKDAIGKDAFLILGDHLYKTKHDNKHPCVQQILECYKEICSDGSALIGLQKSPGDVISHFGAATGTWLSGGNETLKISTLKEKPTVEEATAHLKLPGYDDNSFLTVFGYYVIPSIILTFTKTT